MDIEDQIPPPLPCLPAGRLYKREEFPPLWQRGVRGDFHNNMSFQLWTPL
jgi:hypothetical protein